MLLNNHRNSSFDSWDKRPITKHKNSKTSGSIAE